MTVLKGDLIIYRVSPEAASVQLHDFPRNNPGGCVKHTLQCNWLFTDVFGKHHPYRIPRLTFGMNSDHRVIAIEIIYSTDTSESEEEDIDFSDGDDYLSRRLGPFDETSPGGNEYVAIAFPEKYPNVIEVQLRGDPISGGSNELKDTISLRALAEYSGPEIYLDFGLQFQLVRIRIVYPSEGESGNKYPANYIRH